MSPWGLGTEEEEGFRTGPPGYIGWRNSFLGIDSGAPYTFKNTGQSSPHMEESRQRWVCRKAQRMRWTEPICCPVVNGCWQMLWYLYTVATYIQVVSVFPWNKVISVQGKHNQDPPPHSPSRSYSQHITKFRNNKETAAHQGWPKFYSRKSLFDIIL